MSTRRTLEDRLDAYFEDGLDQLPDRRYEAVRAEIDHTHQRVVIGPWRAPTMNKYALVGIAAAAVVLVAFIGMNFLPRSGGVGGSGPSSSPTLGPPAPSATPVATPTLRPSATPMTSDAPAVRLPRTGDLSAGSYFIDDPAAPSHRLTIAVPDGWRTSDYAFIAKNRDAPGEVMFTPWVVSHVFADSCEWDTAEVVEVPNVDAVVNALAAQGGREASPPQDWPVGGFPGTRIDLSVAPDLDLTSCTSGNQRYWPGAGPDFNSGLCCNPAGNTDAVYAVDVPGRPWVIVARYYPDSSAEDRAELQSIVDSIVFSPRPESGS